MGAGLMGYLTCIYTLYHMLAFDIAICIATNMTQFLPSIASTSILKIKLLTPSFFLKMLLLLTEDYRKLCCVDFSHIKKWTTWA